MKTAIEFKKPSLYPQWSFGVTVWEILTLGKVPYPDLENYQIIGFLENGDRLTKPEVSTDGL